MTAKILSKALVGLTVSLALGCSTAPKTASERQNLVAKAQTALNEFRDSDLSIAKKMDDAYGYAVFPSVAKGGIGIGGAYGRGVIYEQKNMIGYCDLSQGSIGFQLGGQAYRELILFEDKNALERMKGGELALAAQASAVAAASGAGANARYNDGVMVFTLGEKGLMYEASVGGQRFDFEPVH